MYEPAGNVITLAAIDAPEMLLIMVVFNVRLVQVVAVLPPPLVPLACVSLKIAEVVPLAAKVKLALSEAAVKTWPAV